MATTVNLELVAGVAWLTLDGPDARNGIGLHPGGGHQHLLARALVQTYRRTVVDAAAWDRAVEIERARQMWSLTRTTPSKER